MKKKYLYNGQLMELADIQDAAKQSNIDVNAYIQKAGIKEVEDNYSFNGKSFSAKDILDAANQSNLGFDDYIQKAGFQIGEKKNLSENGTPTESKHLSTQSVPTTSQSALAENTNEFNPLKDIVSIQTSDEVGNPIITQSNGSVLAINPKTIPITPFANSQSYINDLQKRIKLGTLTKQDEKVIAENQKGNHNFDLNDEVELTSFVNKYDPVNKDLVNAPIPSILSQFLPDTQGKTFAEVFNTTDGKLAATKMLKEKVYENFNKRYEGAESVPDLDEESKKELKRLSQLETKLSYEKNKSETFPTFIDAAVRTDESGNLWEKFKNRVLLLSPITAVEGMVNMSDEAEIKVQQLPDAFSIGLNGLKYTEPAQFERTTTSLLKGEPLSETLVGQITMQGLEAKEAMAKDAFVDKQIDKQQYNTQLNEIQQARVNTILDNKETTRAFLSNGIANLADDINSETPSITGAQAAAKKIFGHTWNYSDAEIEQYGKAYAQANGFDPNDSRIKEALKYLQDNEGWMITENSIAKSGFARDFAKGLASPIRGISSTIEDIGRKTSDIYAEGQSQGNVDIAEQKLDRVKNSWEGTVSDVLEGTGQFVTQAALAYGVSGAIGGLGRASLQAARATPYMEFDIAGDFVGNALLRSKDAMATFITAYGQSYDGNLKQALTYTSDDNKARITANVMSGLEGATELFLSPITVARGIAKNLFNKATTTKGIVNILSDAAILDKNSAVKNFLKSTAKVVGTEISEEEVTQIADYASNAILNPNSKTFENRDLMNELANTAYQTGLSMVLPALISGVGAANVNNFSKGSLIIAAQNRQQMLDDMNKRLFNGDLTQDEYNEKAAIINTASIANETLPIKENGQKLNSEEKADYIYSRVSEGILKKQSDQSNDEAEKIILNKKIKAQQDFRVELLGIKEEVKPTETSVVEPIVTENKPVVEAAASTIESAVIEINGKTYEGKNHAEAILKAQQDGQDISNVDRQAEGKFKLSDGTIIDRAEAKSRFGQDRSELLIPQDEAANQANKDYIKVQDEEVDMKIAEFQEKFPDHQFDPLEDLPESVVMTFNRVEQDIPTDHVALNEASDWLYNKYKQLVAMKLSPKRRLTIEQIDGMMEQLGEDITLLENHKTKYYDTEGDQPATKEAFKTEPTSTIEVSPIAPTEAKKETIVKEPPPSTVDSGVVETVEDVKLKYNESGEHLAPNGKPSILSENHAKLVRTNKFKEWFGDWENDLENSSKMTDENGEPMIVYHGTRRGEFNEFKDTELGSNTNAPSSKLGHFFSNNPLMAKFYASDKAELLINVGINEDVAKIISEDVEEAKKYGRHPDIYSIHNGYLMEKYGISTEELNAYYGHESGEFGAMDTEQAIIKHINAVEQDLGLSLTQLDKKTFNAARNMDSGNKPTVIKAFLNIKDPLIFDDENKGYREMSYNDRILKAKEENKDGVFIYNTHDPYPAEVYVAFNPKAIRLVNEVEESLKQIRSENKPIQNEQDTQAQEVKLPDTETKTSVADTGVNKVSSETKKGKYTEKAKGLADKVRNADLPQWLVNTNPNIKKSGITGETIKNALADAIEAVGKLLDAGVELQKAINDTFQDFKKVFTDNNEPFDEATLSSGFTDYINEQFPAEPTIKELAESIRKDELAYNDVIEGQNQDFIDKLNIELFGSKKVNFDADRFKEQVRKQKSFGLTEAEVISGFEAAKKLTKIQKGLIAEIFAETAETDKIAKELQESFKQLAKGEKPKSVLKRLSVSNVTQLVDALKDALTYTAVSNEQLSKMADYIVDTIDLSKADQYLNALISNSVADVRQLLRAKLIVALQKDGNKTLATQLIREMADEATQSGRQTQSLKMAYDILGAQGNPATRTEFARRQAEVVQQKAREMTNNYANVISEQKAEIGKLNERLHQKAQVSPLLNKIKDVIANLCGLRNKKK